ncbi:TPA: recombinase RecT [Clostridium botulinum]|uniref:recombinase RecT n=1 Tax=Clostridium botulinum TaxID=1491 RepID=UPI00035BA585|nr:RecT family recombinase [Clostridium botulinum]EPS56402.1 phage-like protein [Clostridium botulinum Af84]MBN3359539.1 recombinase RecT [Clostridium botulinum]NFM84310.1 recombinase RecT [Clostridium botulinum]NFP13131.1 recombinase RecT [Clostridium botulinum]NFR30620.1 recombinase RecT [Clostridium botulinum]
MADKNTTAITLAKEEALNQVAAKISELKKNNEIVFPKNYSVANAVNSAWLMLQDVQDKSKKPALEVCTKNSIIGSLYDMCLQGLTPAKKQCYFVVYGNQLQLMRSYMGTVAVTKRLKGIKDIKAYCIYEGDEFEQKYDVDTATLKITKFNPEFENIDISKIKGAFAVVLGDNGPIHTEVMNINQIRNAWNQGYAKGGSGAHKNFTDEMAKKTVINRACKMFANTSDDSDLLIEAFNNTDKTYDEKDLVNNVEYEVKEEIKEKANSKPLSLNPQTEEPMKEIEIVEAEKVEVKQVEESPNQMTLEGPGF